jgi:S1-C subfamily serine protease
MDKPINSGVRIQQVFGSSFAVSHGFDSTDVIYAVNGQVVNSLDDVFQCLTSLFGAGQTEFSVWRDGELLKQSIWL